MRDESKPGKKPHLIWELCIAAEGSNEYMISWSSTDEVKFSLPAAD